MLIASAIAALFRGDHLVPALAVIATAPIFAWELSLGLWLVIKGFKPSPSPLAWHKRRLRRRGGRGRVTCACACHANRKPPARRVTPRQRLRCARGLGDRVCGPGSRRSGYANVREIAS